MKTVIIAIIAAALSMAQGTQSTVYKKNVFEAATVAAASAALPNIGQAVHIMMAYFPTATADVTGYTLRIEGSFDNTTYFPISEDLTTAVYNGSYSYAITRANGAYPYVRFRYVSAHATLPLTAHYTGAIQPIGLVKLSGTRYVADSPLAGATVDGPGLTISGNYYVYNRRMTPIVTSNWTSYNLNAETVRTNGTGYISLDVWGNTRSYQMVCTTLPASPYRIRVHFLRLNGMRAGDNPNEMGVALRNSSDGKFVLNYIYLYSQWIGGRWASFSSEASQYWNNPGSYDSQPIHSIDIQDDGTNRIWRFWDGFRTYRNFQSTSTEQQLRTEYTTPDQVCFGASGQNGNYRFSATLVGYDVNPTW